MTGEDLEKAYAVAHYTDLAGQAQAERRGAPRRRKIDARLDEAMAIVRAAGYDIVERAK